MSLGVQSWRVIYNGNGSTDTFAIPQSFFSTNSNIVVIVRNESLDVPTETVQTEGVHYAISGTNVVFSPSYIPASQRKVGIFRILSLAQSYDGIDSGAFSPEAVELQLDKIEAQIQQLQGQIDLAIKVKKTAASNQLNMEVEGTWAADAILKMNAAGTAIEMGPTADSISEDVTAAEDAAAAAAASAAAASDSAANAATAETNAETAEANAETAEANAEAAQAAAEAAQAAAEAAFTSLAGEVAAAEAAQAAAEAAQAAAEAAQTAAETAETNAETAETNAETAETNAEAAAVAADASADAAAASALAADASADAAAVSEANAAASVAVLDDFVGDSGSGGSAGLVPAPASGDAAANKFLKADGNWTAIAGGADVPIGAILIGSSGFTPDPAKYLRCDGSLVTRATYTNLSTLPDGMTATPRTVAGAATYSEGATDGAGNIVISGDSIGSNTVHVSTNSGATWATQAVGAALSFTHFAWMGGSVNKFIAIAAGSSTTTHAYASVPTSWTTATTLTTKEWSGVAANGAGTVAVVVCNDDGTTYSSSNGTSFSSAGTLGSAGAAPKAVFWSPSAGLFLAFEHGTTNYWTSTNGASWTTRVCPFGRAEVAQNQRRDYAITANNIFVRPRSGTAGRIFKSPDGVNWTMLNIASADFAGSYNSSQSRIGSLGDGILSLSGGGGNPFLSLSFDEGLTWINVDISGSDARGWVTPFHGMKLTSTSFLVSFDLSSGVGLATVAIDSTKAQLPTGSANQYIRFA